MSYGASLSLQRAIYNRLRSHGKTFALAGDAIFDMAPPGEVPPLYITIGAEQVTARGDASATLARHRLTISVVCEAAGFSLAKELAEAVSDALDGTVPALDRGCITGLRFEGARALRFARGQKRRIDLRFVALVDVPRLNLT